ncbi:MAG: glutamate 5-kinase [Verrucomicrobiales bacterium]|nr:glutamate 5-kinase [Verrucomicrobiales bacterium]
MNQSQTGKRVVIKIGTGVLARGDAGELHHAMIARLAQAIADLCHSGHQCIVVSSGAVGAGVCYFELKERPTDIALKQACAAAGQAMLMHLYEHQFSLHRLKIAQLLLTHDDLENPKRLKNVNNTLSTLLGFKGIIPIINENDSVATFELNVGDNDTLSSKVAQLINADLLILLTAVPGLQGPDAKDENDIITHVEDVDTVLSYAHDDTGKLSVGGMGSKLLAVKSSVSAGIETVIASGFAPEQLGDIVDGKGICTRFSAK